ncbi:Hypothetical predicted protein [Pelobates cultripes]|uniref:Uncharacterized protein n=1 Tax=Pelobates cultripes TaxID=61616 RepID=A0AAD1RAC0_PELCU|nr:Hypothetical predicted protein [Pelobates cultripes]
MPFFLAPNQPKRRKKTGAYPTLTLPGLEALLTQQVRNYPPRIPTDAHAQMPAMGRRSQKSGALDHRDIETLFHRPAQPKTAPAEIPRPTNHNNPGEETGSDRLPAAQSRPHEIPTDSTPTTRQDLKDFHKILAAELAPIKHDMKAITDRVQASETDIADM